MKLPRFEARQLPGGTWGRVRKVDDMAGVSEDPSLVAETLFGPSLRLYIAVCNVQAHCAASAAPAARGRFQRWF